MEYTRIDVNEVTVGILTHRYHQLATQAANLALDRAAGDWCAELRVYAGKKPDPSLSANDSALTAACDINLERAAVVAKMLGAAPDGTAVRAEWLHQYLEQVEAEHAQHATLIALCEVTGEAAQVEASVLAQIRCDAAYHCALAELESLGVKP